MKLSLTIFLFSITCCLWSQIEIVVHQSGSCAGDKVLLVAVGNGPDFSWIMTEQPGSILSTEGFIEVYPEVTTSYTVYDSTDTATVIINMDPNGSHCICKCFVPNIFTPDGDDFNQKFVPIINCDHIGLHMTIYSREQNMVYDSNELVQSWDGTHYQTGEHLQDGVYPYQVSYMKADGELIRLVGFVLLLR